jgi:hypothetical protein
MRLQAALDPVLRAHQREGISARDLREVDGDERAVAVANAEDRHLHAEFQQVAGGAERL